MAKTKAEKITSIEEEIMWYGWITDVGKFMICQKYILMRERLMSVLFAES